MRRSSSYGHDHMVGCSTAAVCAALETLRQIGGRILCFQSSIPLRAGKLGIEKMGSSMALTMRIKCFILFRICREKFV